VNLYLGISNNAVNFYDTDGRFVAPRLAPPQLNPQVAPRVRINEGVPVPVIGPELGPGADEIIPEPWFPSKDDLDENNNLIPRLYRPMKGDIMPEIGHASSRTLGIRDTDVELNDGKCVCPQKPSDKKPQGLSVSTSIDTLQPFLKPKVLGGKNKDTLWYISPASIGPDLLYQNDPVPDNLNHGVISPKKCVPLEEYRKAIEKTQPSWNKQKFFYKKEC
jgi:hypothetical protein